MEQDFKEAVKWYQKAADQGNAIGQYYLAVMYESGEGVKQDYATAYAFLNIAATNGLQEARKNLPQFAKKLNPEQIAKAQELSKEIVKKNPKLIKE